MGIREGFFSSIGGCTIKGTTR